MNLPLPRFTFVFGPGSDFLAALVTSEPCAMVIDVQESLQALSESLCLGSGRASEMDTYIRALSASYLGNILLRDYQSHFSESQIIFAHMKTTTDMGPFVREYGARNCLAIRLGELMATDTNSPWGVKSVWLPPMETSLRIKHLEAELMKDVAPIEASK